MIKNVADTLLLTSSTKNKSRNMFFKMNMWKSVYFKFEHFVFLLFKKMQGFKKTKQNLPVAFNAAKVSSTTFV